MLSRSIRPGARLAQARRSKAAQTLASLDSALLTSTENTVANVNLSNQASESSAHLGDNVNSLLDTQKATFASAVKDANLSMGESHNLLPSIYRKSIQTSCAAGNRKNKISMPKSMPIPMDKSNSLQLARKEFPEMSEIFYTTMRNVLLRSNTNFVTSDIFSFGQGYHHNFNTNYNGNSNGMVGQCRSFSSTPNKSDSDDTNAVPKATKIPVPSRKFNAQEQSMSVKANNAAEKAQQLTISALKSLANMIAKTPGVMYYYTTHPKEFKEKLKELSDLAKKEAHHYYMGGKLLVADVRTAKQIIGRTLHGTPLTRRERKQLLRTVTDVFRLVPMSIFVLIPFMEFALPFALKIFPNMLPSTFQDSLKAEENMKRDLKSRLAMAEFFQETLQDLAKGQKKKAEKNKKTMVANDGPTSEIESSEDREETAASFLEFIEKSRNGEFLPPNVIVKYAKYFKDELTLDNMPRMQLINMCKYMSIPPYGNDNVLRFQLRHKVRGLQEDDQRILWEGIDSLTKMELREACQERGMRSTGLSKEAYKRALQQWIDLSVSRNVPISLLVMSRTFFLQDETTGKAVGEDVTGLADAISGLDKELVNEVILESVSGDNKKDPELLKLKLEVLEAQNELIEEEKQQRDAEVAKAKAEKEKAEKEVKEEIHKDVSVEEPIPPVESAYASTIITKDEFVISEGEQTGKATMEETPFSTEEDKEDDEPSLSSEEIDAISQLVNPDPVSAEREKLESLKAALKREKEEKEEEEGEAEEAADAEQEGDSKSEPEESLSAAKIILAEEITAENTDNIAEQQIAAMNKKVQDESEASTQMSFDGKIDGEAKTDSPEPQEEEIEEEEDDYHDKKLDKAISRLKSKVESMVGNLEIQLSDVEAKIGDKLHFLDKDMDGILSREEMAICLQSVLKRPLTVDEAMAIAADMDENEDGLFSVEELSKWLETNKLVKLVEEGRDAEVDKIIEIQAAKMKEQNTKKEEER